jgi:dTDP-4-amino-4,6-dideoxygalactose transaminase
MTYYRRTYGLKPEDFPRATAAFYQAVSLPIYPGLSEEQLARIVETVRRLVSPRVKSRVYAGAKQGEKP